MRPLFSAPGKPLIHSHCVAIAVALCAFPLASHAFQTTDDIVWPDSGRFPAYPTVDDNANGHNIHLWVSGGLYHDDNLFRVSGSVDPHSIGINNGEADTISRVGLGLKADLPVSRQHLVIEASADSYHYEHYSLLNNTSSRLAGTWLWQAGNQWSGQAGVSTQRYLADFGELQAPLQDMVTESHLFGSAIYALSPSWHLHAGTESVDYRHDLAIANLEDNTVTAVTVGADYVTATFNTLGAQVKYSNGRYPNSQLVGGALINNDFHETETSLVTHWQVTGKSIIDARLGYTNRRHDQIGQRDFSGATGRFDYTYLTGTKIAFVGQAWRELRAYEALPGSFTPTFGDFTASYVLSDGVSFGPQWAPTSTITVQAELLWEKRSFKGDPTVALTGLPDRQDIYHGAQLGLGYKPLQNLRLALAFDHGNRSSNYFGRDFIFNAIYANARYTFY